MLEKGYFKKEKDAKKYAEKLQLSGVKKAWVVPVYNDFNRGASRQRKLIGWQVTHE